MAHLADQPPERIAKVVERFARRDLRHHWRLYLVEGALLVLLGLAATIAPNVASLAVDVFIGWLLFVIGTFTIAARLATPTSPGFWPALLLGLVTTALGAILALWPGQGVLTLTAALTAYLIAHAIGMVLLAYSMREGGGNWAWLFVSAFVDCILVGLILSGWPGTAGWVLGLFAGINFLFAGLGMIFAALGARTAP